MPRSLEDGKKKPTRAPRLAITLGDPAGIGPEVVLKSISNSAIREIASEIILIGAIPNPLKNTTYYHCLQKFLRSGSVRFIDITCDIPAIHPHRSVCDFLPGKPSEAGGLAAFLAIKKAAEMALSGEVDGIVTAPVSKVSLELARGSGLRLGSEGIFAAGHTEILQKLTRSKSVQMVMCARFGGFPFKKNSKEIKVLLVTRHLPLCEVPGELTISKVVAAACDYASVFGKKTQFVVCALNPHAGDNGLLGDEEKKIILPAVARLKKSGFSVSGPFPADAVFRRIVYDDEKKPFDCVLAMYHDQAMIPLKIINPRGIVNLTIGLPFIRTSPGHGVAYDIAARPGFADEKPMSEAIIFASEYGYLWKKQ